MMVGWWLCSPTCPAWLGMFEQKLPLFGTLFLRDWCDLSTNIHERFSSAHWPKPGTISPISCCPLPRIWRCWTIAASSKLRQSLQAGTLNQGWFARPGGFSAWSDLDLLDMMCRSKVYDEGEVQSLSPVLELEELLGEDFMTDGMTWVRFVTSFRDIWTDLVEKTWKN